MKYFQLFRGSSIANLVVLNCLQRDTLEQASTPPVLNDRVVVESHLDFVLAAAHLVDDAAVELFGKVDNQLVDDPLAQCSNHKNRAVFV